MCICVSLCECVCACVRVRRFVRCGCARARVCVVYVLLLCVCVLWFMWQFRDADWDRLSEDIQAFDWTPLETMDPNAAAEFFTTSAMDLCEQCIQRKLSASRRHIRG